MPDDPSAPSAQPPTLPCRIQARLSDYYGIDDAPDVDDFIEPADGDRETLFVREEGGDLEVLLRLPRAALDAGKPARFDELCQVIEGVNHFVYLAERARRELPATQLELELQAEVDKWVVLAASMRETFDEERSAALRTRLYERVSFDHPATTGHGERYRIANDAAHRFVRRLEREYVGRARFSDMRGELLRFFHVGQEEKLRLGRAA